MRPDRVTVGRSPICRNCTSVEWNSYRSSTIFDRIWGVFQESRVARVIALTMTNPESKRAMLLVAWAKSAVEKCKRQ